MTSSQKLPVRRDFLAGLLPISSLPSHPGASILIRVADRRVLALTGSELASRWLAPPGSTIKPLSLLALLEAGKLRASEEYPCPRNLVIAGRSLPCVHPILPIPMNASRAISYSCNCAVAHFAARFAPGELAQALRRCGLASPTGFVWQPEASGIISPSLSRGACQLQSLGEDGVRLTPLELLFAYRVLAQRIAQPALAPILEGLEGAVAFGTARAAAHPHIPVAGKTGSVIAESGVPLAWFAGFAPSRAPEVAVVVAVPGRSGGADAAPLAGSLLRAYFK